MAHYELFTSGPDGLSLIRLHHAAIQFSLVEGNSTCVVTVPAASIDPWRTEVDNRLYIYRHVAGSATLQGYAPFFVRRRAYQVRDDPRQSIVTLHGYAATTLLGRRVVAYAKASSQSDKSGAAGNLMKAYVRENLGASAGAGRDLSAYLSVGADIGDGATVTISGARAGVDTIIEQIAASSAQQGTLIKYIIEDNGFYGLSFRTSALTLGVDHRFLGTSDPARRSLLFDPAIGNIADVVIDEDWTKEITAAYAAGTGEESDRVVSTAATSTRATASVLNRIETVVDARDQGITAARLTNAAQGALHDGRPSTVVTGTLVDYPGYVYGIDYNWLDLVTVQANDTLFHVAVDQVAGSVGPEGEQLTISVRGPLT